MQVRLLIEAPDTLEAVLVVYLGYGCYILIICTGKK